MNRVAKFVLVLALTMTAAMTHAETLEDKFERAKRALLDAGTSKDHINSITLVAQLIARDKGCPPDDKAAAYRAGETEMQARQTGLSREAIVAKAEAFVPLMAEALNSDPAEKAVACTP